MRVVLDTNVLVSGLLSPYGASSEMVRIIVSGGIELLYDARILSEYEDVLRRPKFDFDKTLTNNLLDYLEHVGIPVAAVPLEKHLRDRDDEPFLEVAISGKAECLISGNLAHYPTKTYLKTLILNPRQFLNRYF